jgi:hypothetical protein
MSRLPHAAPTCFALLLAAFALRASAGIVLLSDDRTLGVSGGAQGGPGSPWFSRGASSNGALVFNQKIEDQAVSQQGFGGYASAEQNSTLSYSSTVLSFVATGLTHGGTYPNSYTPGGTASGSSNFAIKFQLDTPATYHLDVTREEDSISGNTAGVLLYKGTATVAGLAYPSRFYQQSFDGTLEPGTYSLEGHSGGIVGPDLWHNSFDTSFTVSAVSLPPAGWAVIAWLPVGWIALLSFKHRLANPASSGGF